MPLFEPLEQRTLLATIHWDGGGDGESWHDAANWNGDVLPGPLDTAVINRIAEDPTVVFSTGEVNIYNLRSEENLTITGGRLVCFETNWMAGTLTITGGTLLVGIQWNQLGPAALSGGAIDGIGQFIIKDSMDWTGGSLGDLSTPGGRVIIAPGATLTINGNVTLDRVLVNDGTLDWQSGTLSFERGQLYNMAGRTIDLPTGATIASLVTPVGRLVNRGTINMAGGATLGVQYIQVAGAATNLTGGILIFQRGGFIDGTLTTAAATELRVAGDALQVSLNVLPTATFTLGGLLSVTGGRLGLKPAGLTITDLSISGGSLTLPEDTTIVGFMFTGGAFGGTGELLLTGNLTWTGGQFVASDAELVIDAGAEMEMVSVSFPHLSTRRPIRVLGTLQWTDGYVQVYRLIHVESGGEFHASADRTMSFRTAAGGLLVDGLISRSGFGSSLLYGIDPASPGATLNTGATVQAGRLAVLGNGGVGGTVTVAEDAFFGLGAWGGTVVVDPGAVFTGPGTLEMMGGPGGGTVVMDGTIETARFDIFTTVNLDAATLNAAVTELKPNGLIVGDADLVLSESFLWTGGGFGGTGTTIIPAGATATLNGGGLYVIQRRFINRGTLTLIAGTVSVGLDGEFIGESGSILNITGTTGPGPGPQFDGGQFGVVELQSGSTLNATRGAISGSRLGAFRVLGELNKLGAETFEVRYDQTGSGGSLGGEVNVNAGTLLLVGNEHAASFAVASGATLHARMGDQNQAVFAPASSITGAGTLVLDSGARVEGTLDIGRLEAPGSGTTPAAVLQSGLKRAGTVSLTGGTLLLGAATTLAVTGDFDHTAGRLQMRIGGAGLHAKINAGALNLAGGPPVALETIYWGGFTPSVGQTFTLISSVARSGQFGTVTLPVQPAGMIADLNYIPGHVQLAIVPA